MKFVFVALSVLLASCGQISETTRHATTWKYPWELLALHEIKMGTRDASLNPTHVHAAGCDAPIHWPIHITTLPDSEQLLKESAAHCINLDQEFERLRDSLISPTLGTMLCGIQIIDTAIDEMGTKAWAVALRFRTLNECAPSGGFRMAFNQECSRSPDGKNFLVRLSPMGLFPSSVGIDVVSPASGATRIPWFLPTGSRLVVEYITRDGTPPIHCTLKTHADGVVLESWNATDRDVTFTVNSFPNDVVTLDNSDPLVTRYHLTPRSGGFNTFVAYWPNYDPIWDIHVRKEFLNLARMQGWHHTSSQVVPNIRGAILAKRVLADVFETRIPVCCERLQWEKDHPGVEYWLDAWMNLTEKLQDRDVVHLDNLPYENRCLYTRIATLDGVHGELVPNCLNELRAFHFIWRSGYDPGQVSGSELLGFLRSPDLALMTAASYYSSKPSSFFKPRTHVGGSINTQNPYQFNPEALDRINRLLKAKAQGLWVVHISSGTVRAATPLQVDPQWAAGTTYASKSLGIYRYSGSNWTLVAPVENNSDDVYVCKDHDMHGDDIVAFKQ